MNSIYTTLNAGKLKGLRFTGNIMFDNLQGNLSLLIKTYTH